MSGRVRIGCVWVVGLLEHAGGGWVAWRGAAGRGRAEGERARAVVRVRVYMCASVRARGMGGYSGG